MFCEITKLRLLTNVTSVHYLIIKLNIITDYNLVLMSNLHCRLLYTSKRFIYFCLLVKIVAEVVDIQLIWS